MQREEIAHTNLSELVYPSFSIVIEWGRFLQTDEAYRAKATLKRLSEQIQKISKKISFAEIIIVFSPEEITNSEIKKFALEQLHPCINLIDLRIIPTDLLYYEMKNYGAQQSTNELILIVDSDVIIDDDWVVNYLESFKDPEIKVVAGHTYLGLNTLLEKVLGLVLFQPLPDTQNMYENGQFYGNNLGIRRKTFLRHPFPKIKSFHGQCTYLTNDLLKNKIKIYRQPNCRVAHPMPVTFKQFLSWGFVQGLCYPIKRRGNRVAKKLNLFNQENNPSTFSKVIERTKKRIRYVGLSPSVIIGSLGILPAYFGIMFLGALVATLWPNHYDYMVRHDWAKEMWL